MNMKKVIASVAASALAVSAMAASAFAVDAITFVDGTGKAELGDSGHGEKTKITWNVADVIPEGVDIADVYGFRLVFDGEFDAQLGTGGSFILSSKGSNWKGIEWGNEGAAKPITYNAENKTLTRMEETAFFNATDISGAEGEYAQVVIEAYWGSGELTVKAVNLLDKDGKALGAAAGEETPAGTTQAEETPAGTTEAEETPAGTTAASGDDGKTPTGVGIEGVAVVAGLAVIATGAIVIVKKRK